MIGACDCCDRQEVPLSHFNVDGDAGPEAFVCYLCQGESDDDPYRELEDVKMERAALGIDGNAGFALLGDDLQSGEAEFVTIDLPPEASKDPNRYHKSEWVVAAKGAANLALRNLRQRLGDRKFSYYLDKSYPDYLG